MLFSINVYLGGGYQKMNGSDGPDPSKGDVDEYRMWCVHGRANLLLWKQKNN